MSDASPVLLTPDVVGGLAGKRVLVVGDIMLDAYLIGDADRISPEAPVPVVRIEKERYLLGGAGNVARNIVALGGGMPCSVCSSRVFVRALARTRLSAAAALSGASGMRYFSRSLLFSNSKNSTAAPVCQSAFCGKTVEFCRKE